MMAVQTLINLLPLKKLEITLANLDGRSFANEIPGSIVGVANLHAATRRPAFVFLKPRYKILAELEAALAAAAGSDKKTPPAERLVIDLWTNSVALDGEHFEHIDPLAVRILQAFHNAGGSVLTSKEIQRTVKGCTGDPRNVSRAIDKLPGPLKFCVKGASGIGRWLELPQNKP